MRTITHYLAGRGLDEEATAAPPELWTWIWIREARGGLGTEHRCKTGRLIDEVVDRAARLFSSNLFWLRFYRGSQHLIW